MKRKYFQTEKGFFMLVSRKILTVAIFFFLIPSLLFPQEGKYLKQIVKRGELRIGTSASQPPFSMKSKTGELMGFEIEVAKMLKE